MDTDSRISEVDYCQRFAHPLLDVANRLEKANNLADYSDAIEANSRLWDKLGRANIGLSLLGLERFVAFSLILARKARMGIDDYEVECLVRISRSLAVAILEQGAPTADGQATASSHRPGGCRSDSEAAAAV